MFGKLTFVPASGGRSVEHLVAQRLTYVGRDKDCAIRLEDNSVDGKQFVITVVDQVATIQNLSRKLPTQVNHKTIGLREDRVLKNQDSISFGNKQFLWTMSASSGKRNTPRHDCLKRARVSEPVRKVAVVTPNRRDAPLDETLALVSTPPEKRRRTMFDPSAATPDASSFARRVKYDKQLRQKTPNRRKMSVGRTTPAASNSKKKSISFAVPLESPQLSYHHASAFNKSITPGRFYRRNDAPFTFGGFNPVPEGGPMSPGFLSGCDSFLSMEDSQVSRRSSSRVSTPHPNKSLRGSSQSTKTPQSKCPSGLYFPSIQEEVTHRSKQGATPSSYFSSTSGSPRMMRAESPSILPGGSGSAFQRRRSLVNSSQSSSYGTPQEHSLHTLNDSMYVNASGSSQMRLQDFEGSSLNQSRCSWTNEGVSSPQSELFARTPPQMRTPRRSRYPVESPGSAAFSPSESNTSGYVLLSPQGRSIINRAFNRNDLSLQLSPQHSPSRRLFNFSARTPNNRHIVEPPQPLSVQVLTKSLKKKLDRSVFRMNSAQNQVSSPGSSSPGGTQAMVKTPTRNAPVEIGTPKSTRSSVSKRAPSCRSSNSDAFDATTKSVDTDLGGLTPIVQRSSGKEEKIAASPILSRRSLGGIPRQSSEPGLSRVSRKLSDLNQSSPSAPAEMLPNEPKRSQRFSEKGLSPSTSPASNNADLSTGKVTPSVEVDLRSSRRSSIKRTTPGSIGGGGSVKKLDASIDMPSNQDDAPPIRSSGYKKVSRRQSFEPDLTVTGVSSNLPVGISSPDVESRRRSSVKVDGEVKTPPKLSRRSLGATHRPSSAPEQRRGSQKLRWSTSSTPVIESYAEPKKSNRTSKVSSSPFNSPTFVDGGLSPDKVTPSNTSVVINMRSSRKMSTKKKYSPSTPLTASPKSSARGSLPVSLKKSARKSASSSVREVDKEKSVSKTSSGSLIDSPISTRRSRASLIGDAVQLLHLSASPRGSQINPGQTKKLVTAISPAVRSSAATPPGKSVLDLRSSGKAETPAVASLHQKRTSSEKASIKSETPEALVREVSKAKVSTSRSSSLSKSPRRSKARTPPSIRRSRASLVGDAAQFLQLTSTPGVTKETQSSPDVRAIATPASREHESERRSTRKSGTPSFVSLHRGVRKTSSGKKSLSPQTEVPVVAAAAMGSGSRSASVRPNVRTSVSTRRSRASLVGEAVQLLHLSASPVSSQRTPGQKKSFIPELSVTPRTSSPRSSGGKLGSGEPVRGRRSPRKSGTLSVLAVPSGIRRSSIGKRPSPSSENQEISGSVGPESPTKSPSVSKHSFQKSSAVKPVNAASYSSPPSRFSRSSRGSAQVTPPRSVEPEIVMRSSRKTPRPQLLEVVPSTPTSALRRNARRSSKRSPVPSIQKKLAVSPRKGSVVKKLSLDPEKPDKNKMAALIACHKKKSPTKENRPSVSSSDEKNSYGKSIAEHLTPLKDLDAQPEERSPEDNLLDALDLYRKSAIADIPKRPSRRLRSSTSHLTVKASVLTSSKSLPSSPPKSVKKLLFKTPLVEYEGSQSSMEKNPPTSLKGILIPSPTTASEEPMSRVFTTSPVVDFTDASGRKKTFRTSPNSKSKAGGIRELVPTDESDMNIWTLFEDSSSGSESSGRKRKGSVVANTNSPKKAKTLINLGPASPPQSRRRKRPAEGTSNQNSKSSRKSSLTEEASLVKSTRESSKAASSKSTRRNLQEQFVVSPRPSTSQDSSMASSSNAAYPLSSPKQSRKVGPKTRTDFKVETVKKASAHSKASGTTAQKVQKSPEKSPAKTRSRSVASSSKKRLSNPPRAGKTRAIKPTVKPAVSKAKPKKVVQSTKSHSKASGGKTRKSPSLAKSPPKPKRGAVAKSPKKVEHISKASARQISKTSPVKTRRGAVVPKKVQTSKVQPKAGRIAAAPSPIKSPPKTRKAAAAESPKKSARKLQTKAGKTGEPTKRPPVSTSQAKPEKATGKVKSSPKPSTSKAKPKKAIGKVKSPPKPSSSKAKPTKAASKAKSALKPTATKPKSPLESSSSKSKIPPVAANSKSKLTKASAPSPSPKVSPKKLRSKSANVKAGSKPAEVAKPIATGAKPNSALKPRLSVVIKPLKRKAVGVKLARKSSSPKKSPVRTRSRKPASASTAPHSRGKR